MRKAMLPSKPQETLFIAIFIFSSLSQLAIVEPRPQFSSPTPNPHEHPHPSFNHLNQNQRINLRPKSASTRQGWLEAHNEVRQAMGEPPMTWDNSLARYARRFAAKRINDCLMIHSDGPHGENIFWAARNIFSPAQIVAKWVDEQQNYNRTGNICAANKVCGHYKQVVWRDSLKVGCSMVQCLNGGAYAICSYDPPGNYRGEDPFTRHI